MSVQNPTFGEVQFQLQKRHPGIDSDILASYINERLRRIGRRIPWQSTEIQDVIQTVEAYVAGTVSVTAGSDAIDGTDTTWTSLMTGRCIRIGSDSAYYEFTYVSAVEGSLDRNYEGATNATASHSIWQNVFTLPSRSRKLSAMRTASGDRTLDRISMAGLDEMAPNRTETGDPWFYAMHMDDREAPRSQRVEVYPVPIAVGALPYWYTQDPTLFDVGDTEEYLPTWLNPDVLYAGVAADAAGREKDYAGATLFEQKFTIGLNEMLAAECERMPGVQIQMADRFSRHRDVRGSGKRFPFQLP